MTAREAAIALRAASEAVATARDAVVLAAKVTCNTGGSYLRKLSVATGALEEAERAEAEARARLEALR